MSIPKITIEALEEAFKKSFPKNLKELTNQDIAKHLQKFQSKYAEEQEPVYLFLLNIIQDLYKNNTKSIPASLIILYVSVIFHALYIQEELNLVSNMLNLETKSSKLDIAEAAGYGGQNLPNIDIGKLLKDILDSKEENDEEK